MNHDTLTEAAEVLDDLLIDLLATAVPLFATPDRYQSVVTKIQRASASRDALLAMVDQLIEVDGKKPWWWDRRCCDKARPLDCVCTWASTCPDHGERHHGTHD